MENTPKTETNDGLSSSSTPFLNFDPADLVRMRIKPAHFARLCQVSRESVSQWIKKGLISTGPDGLIDPIRASQELLSRSDPARLRARLFRDAARDVDELRAQFKQAKSDLETTRAALADLEARHRHFEHTDTTHARLNRFVSAITEHDTGLTADDLDILAARYFWGRSDDDLTDTYGADEMAAFKTRLKLNLDLAANQAADFQAQRGG